MGVSIKNIKKSFKDFNIDVDLEIEKGELITLLGPSGCGKTTLIQLISGIIPPGSGAIHIGSKDVTTMPVWSRDIGIVFQDYALFPHMNVGDNIAYGLKARKTKSSLIKKRVTEMLELVQLMGYGKRSVSSLSGGEKQRTALARALAPSPLLLLLDEPLSALDAKMRTILRREIRSIQKELGITTIYVTHDQEEALSISDRIVVMNNGRVEQKGRPWEIYNQPASGFSADFMGESNKIPCTVEEVSEPDGISLVSSDGDINFRVPYRKKIKTGEKYFVFFRPQDTEVIHDGTNKTGENMINAKILSTEYFGRYLSFDCKAGNTLLKTEISDRQVLDSKIFKVGDPVIFTVNQERCWLIRN
ncbi:MAG: ABC transporter ATP-binding protein [Spirochaetales bacterium]|nr:ABC transporter ATP-binding protein [Spirochaetales bacterium]